MHHARAITFQRAGVAVAGPVVRAMLTCMSANQAQTERKRQPWSVCCTDKSSRRADSVMRKTTATGLLSGLQRRVKRVRRVAEILDAVALARLVDRQRRAPETFRKNRSRSVARPHNRSDLRRRRRLLVTMDQHRGTPSGTGLDIDLAMSKADRCGEMRSSGVRHVGPQVGKPGLGCDACAHRRDEGQELEFLIPGSDPLGTRLAAWRRASITTP